MSLKNKIISSGIVIDNEDPMRLNRIRVQLDTVNYESVINSVPDTYNGKQTKDLSKTPIDLLPEFKWSKIDPLCFLPFIPLYLNILPKNGEYVNIIYPNVEYKYTEQYYIKGPISSPLTMNFEDGNTSRMFTTRERVKTTITPNNSKTEGIFADYDDVQIFGRGTADLIIKDNDLIFRAGRSTNIPNNSNTILEGKNTRSFLQLSNFNTRLNYLGNNERLTLLPDDSYVKTLIEWSIINPENQFNNFNAVINFYKLVPKSGYTCNNLEIDSIIESVDTSLITTMNFNGTKDEIVIQINKFLTQINDGNLNIKPYPRISVNNQFPCYFRPSQLTYKWLQNTTSSGTSEYFNVSSFYESIQFKTLIGSGLIYSNKLVGKQQKVKIISEKKYSENNISTTYGILGADKLLFLSHESEIPDKRKINLGQNTLLGIDQSKLIEDIVPNTNAFVRGEQLITFMNLMTKFLIAHTHAFPGLPPVPIATDGTNIQEILTALQNAPNTILNQNIRIN